MGKKKKRRRESVENLVDINGNWQYICCCYDEYNSSEIAYFYDKINNSFVIKRFLSEEDQNHFDELIGSRYIKLFQVIKEEQYKSMIKLINNKAVTNWFLSSASEEERYDKYNRFLDWNCIYEIEGYRLYLEIYPKLIKWCEENQLPYLFRGKLSPPENYNYSRKWEIPSD